MLLSVLFLYSTFYALVVYFTVCRLKGINRDKSMPKSTKRGVLKEVISQATRGLTRPPVSPETGHVRCHTLIFDPPEMTYLQDFHQVKISTQSSQFSIWYLIGDAQRQESSGKGSINTRISL